ncbi:MAG: hypothetical protein KatS3mg002_0396 [Candidatus Woesearchaeota archaeon]|nr:MAG: hypothetical protein KatS3mg002_0396 [Candidatus Woesearchaeota archaeon]
MDSFCFVCIFFNHYYVYVSFFGDESLKIKMTIIIASILFFVLSFIFKNRVENYNGKKYLKPSITLKNNVSILEECMEIPYDIDPCEPVGAINLKTGEKIILTENKE